MRTSVLPSYNHWGAALLRFQCPVEEVLALFMITYFYDDFGKQLAYVDVRLSWSAS
jgi:hypothetical protein